MRIIITGGTGLIGRALTGRLVARGDDVTVLTRNPRPSAGLPQEAHVVTWDGKTGQSWRGLITADTAIINLAGESIASGRWTSERKERIRVSRVNAGEAIVEAIRTAVAPPFVVIQASAVGYYGPLGSEDVDENVMTGSDYLARVCVAWEESTAPVESLGVRRAVIRTGVVLASNGGALPSLLLPFRFFAGGPLGSGRQQVPWIHLDDEVSAIVFLLDNSSARGPFNLTDPRPISNAELSRVIGRVLGRPALVRTPSFVLRTLLGEMATIVLDGQRALPSRLLSAGFQFRYEDAETAIADIVRSRR